MSARLTWANPPDVPRPVWLRPDNSGDALPCAVCGRPVGGIGYGEGGRTCWGCQFGKNGRFLTHEAGKAK